MVWEKSDEKVMCSSIAMLQERFRQLEKVKEMREERELLKLISSSVSSINNIHQCNPCFDQQPVTSNSYHDPNNSKFLFFSKIILPTRPLDSQLLSLSLWPSSQMKNNHAHDSYWDIKIENTENLTSKPSWLNDVVLARPSLIKKTDESSVVGCEVDTTLHL